MPGRRKALVLRKTSAVVSSLIGHSREHGEQECIDLNAGILLSDSQSEEFLVAVSSSVLLQLSITSGSWVVVKNLQNNVSRPAKALVLDPPTNTIRLPPCPARFFPSCTTKSAFEGNVAYISPFLAFNLALHIPWLETLVTQRKLEDSSEYSPFSLDKTSSTLLRIAPLDDTQTKVASHMRISFVRLPVLSSNLRLDTSVNRQEEVDVALQQYYKGGRIMATGDLFCTQLRTSTSTSTDYYDYFHFRAQDDNVVIFKVTSLEPSTEQYLRIDQNHTALVLSGSVPSQLPPIVLKRNVPRCSSLHAPLVRELVSLIAPCLHPNIPALRISTLLLGPIGVGKRSTVKLVAEALGIHVVEYNCYELVGASEGKTSLALENAFKTASRYSPTILLLRRLGALAESISKNPDQPQGPSRIPGALKSYISDYSKTEASVTSVDIKNTVLKEIATSVVLIATAEDEDSVKPLRHCFTHEFSLSTPDENQRFEFLTHFLGDPNLSDDLLHGLKSISSQTAGLVPRDLSAVAADIAAFALDTKLDYETGLILTADIIEKALEQIKKRTASAIGTPKVPNVKWEDIGGLEDVKKAILDTVQIPLLHRGLFTSGLRQRSGVMLYGPPGTGKTLLAKAVATECSLNFLSVKGPELINMFIGESEKNVREIFQKARGARPCVIFFDEMDALAPARGASGDSGGVMDRVVSQLLAEIDGLGDNAQDLFVIGATNRPDLVDSALLRPGRFDKLLYVGVSPDPVYREKVLSALARKFDLDEDVSLRVLARKCSANFTGADMYALCADAWMQAVKRKASSSAEEDDSAVIVRQEDFLHALAELKPSLSMEELAKYERLRYQFQGSS